MKKNVSKPSKAVPKITPKIDPDMPANIVSSLLDSLAGAAFILITEKDETVRVCDYGLKTKMEFLGLLELAKDMRLGDWRNGR